MIGTAEPSTKLVYGEVHTVTPFFGTDREGEFAQMGVGFVTESGQVSMWGLLAPSMMITSWRAMKILTCLATVDRSTLCKCWYAAAGTSRDTADAIEALSYQFDNPGTLSELIATNPSSEELDQMLRFVKERGIEVNTYELQDLVEQGLIDDHPIIAELEAKAAKARHDYERRERFIAEPMHERDSLAAFFTLLDIDNLLDGVPFGGYGFDWGHIKLGDLDSMIKQRSTGEYASPFTILHTTESPETTKTSYGKGSATYSTSFGDIEPPYFVDAAGTRYTFISAEYRHDNIVVAVQVGEGDDARNYNLPVADLREMIVVKQQKKRWFRRR